MSDLEKDAIELIKMGSRMSFNYYQKPLIVTYSGGKDSDVMLELFKRSGVPFEVCHSLTTVDAPETVQHIKEVFRDLEMNGIKTFIDKHDYKTKDGTRKRKTMWNLIVSHGILPSRTMRYCCVELKENTEYTKNRMISTGVRWEESSARRRSFESLGKTKKDGIKISEEQLLTYDSDESKMFFDECKIRASTIINPIINWTSSDIYDYGKSEKICFNELYECGFSRIGCIGCPMAGKGRFKQFNRYPKYKDAYLRSIDKMLQKRKSEGKLFRKEQLNNVEGYFDWWMESDTIQGQMSFDDFPEIQP